MAWACLCPLADLTGEAVAAVAASTASTRTMKTFRNMKELCGETRATPVYDVPACVRSTQPDTDESDNWTLAARNTLAVEKYIDPMIWFQFSRSVDDGEKTSIWVWKE